MTIKKTLSYALAFSVGFVICAFALKALYGLEPSGLLGGSSNPKEAVLARLNSKPAQLRLGPADREIADAAAKVEPAVVDVHTVGKAIEQADPFSDDPFFRQFFGGPRRSQEQAVRPQGAGSGIIISPDGYILTNNHVVADTEQVTVNVKGKGYTAKVVGTDPMTDIAVCKIEAKGVDLPVAELGDSDAIRIGDWAIAVGNPLNVGTTVTLGIISAMNKTGLSAEGHSLNSVIQTDAAINPGNSGGALANINGQVIGINEAIYSPTGSYVGIGFAIPINAAKRIATELIRNGKIVYPYLGVTYAPLKSLSEDARHQIGINTTGDDGAIVTQVLPGSPADAAGIQRYDVVLEADRQKIVEIDDLNKIIQKKHVGDTLVLLVMRDGQSKIVPVKLKERPQNYGQIKQQQQMPQQQMIPMEP